MPELDQLLTVSDYLDTNLLASNGYKPKLQRKFSKLKVIGIAFAIVGLVLSVAATLSVLLPAGGYDMIWGWLVASSCIVAVGLAMAELGSSLPTSGGLHWWTYHFAPSKAKQPLSFLVGYTNALGLTGGTMFVDYCFAQIFASMIVVCTDGKWNPSPYVVYGIFAVCVVSHAYVGSIGTKHMANIQTVCICANIAIIIVMIIALPFGERNHSNSGGSMLDKGEYRGWPAAWVFLLAWLAPIWTMGGLDCLVPMTERGFNVAISAPFRIMASTGVCWILGFVVVIAFVALMPPDSQSFLFTVYQQPFAQVVYDTFGKSWTIGVMTAMAILQWTMGLSSMISASRQSWAFSRDGALPFSSFLKVVDEKYSSLVQCVWVTAFIELCVGFLCVTDTSAASALFSLSVRGNCLAWLIPITLKLCYGQRSFVPGPFYFGKTLSKLIGGLASLYLVFVLILLQFPQTSSHLTKDTMKYTCIILGTVWGGSLATIVCLYRNVTKV